MVGMQGFVGNIEKMTLENTAFRRVLFTGVHEQLVAMSLLPNEEIGMEVHTTHDQFFRIEKGEMKIIIDGKVTQLTDGGAAIVPAGAQHNVINTTSTNELKLYTIYAPPQHPRNTVHLTKKEADAAEHH
jgi:mannose-6-phosphate isomerase-like protein (cupin superfamily)